MPRDEVENVFAFTIGDAFPAEDPVARFVVATAMMSNDLLRVGDLIFMEEGPERSACLFYLRVQISLFFEASSFLREAHRRWPVVAAFVASLDAEAREDFDLAVAAADKRAAAFVGDWLEQQRNLTFHYAEMHPSRPAAKDAMSRALEACREVVGEIAVGDGELLRSVRFGFADAVAVHWLPGTNDPSAVIDEMQDRVAGLVRFAHRAVAEYLGNGSGRR